MQYDKILKMNPKKKNTYNTIDVMTLYNHFVILVKCLQVTGRKCISFFFVKNNV